MWAYHGTSINKSYNSKNKVFLNLDPEQIGFYHLNNIREKGLEPRVSRRQTLLWRKSILKGRLLEKFVYYYPEPLSLESVHGLVTRYGEGLTIGSAGMLLRFPEPRVSWVDPDSSECRMTSKHILPNMVEIFTPPKKYYNFLSGLGSSSYSPWDYANRYLFLYCINKDRFWTPLNEVINPWCNQIDQDLTSLG